MPLVIIISSIRALYISFMSIIIPDFTDWYLKAVFMFSYI